MEQFLRMDPPKGRVMWLNIQMNFFFAKSFARFLEMCISLDGGIPTFIYNTVKQEFSILFEDVLVRGGEFQYWIFAKKE